MRDPETFLIQRYTSKELAGYYRCSERTINRWINRLKIGKPVGHFYSTGQIRQIVEKLGTP